MLRAKWKWTLWTVIALLLAIVASASFIENRGGHYPIHNPSEFTSLVGKTDGVAAATEPMVQTASGALRGVASGSAVAFRGIPYARPPVGDLRWQPPQPPLSWSGVRDAQVPGNTCTQRVSGLTSFFAPMAQAYGSNFEQPPIRSSEDCLYLDVWTPEWPVKQALPVMVWLHGGSNTVGSGTQTTYNGNSLVRHGVLLVTINYRLGVMGFFSHPELTKESPNHSSGNYGLLDQLAALNWVRQNIAQFGGDPDNVTLFGESAGAIDATRLMTSPLAAGLFKRVISESGPAFEPGQTLSQAEQFGSAVGSLATDGTQGAQLQKLRAMSATDVEALVLKAKQRFPTDITAATADGWVLPVSPRQAYLTGAIQKVDLLIGLNGRELSAFRLAAAAAKSSGGPASGALAGGLGKFYEAAHPYFGRWTDAAIAMYLGKMLTNKTAGLDQAANDLIGGCPVGAIANLTTAAGQRVYVYRFDRVVPGKGAAELGAFHSLEVPYIFGSLGDREWLWLPSTTDDASLSGLLQNYWTDFAKSGDPNAPGLPNWPVWSEKNAEFLLVNREGGVTEQRSFPPLFSRLGANNLKQSFGIK